MFNKRNAIYVIILTLIITFFLSFSTPLQKKTTPLPDYSPLKKRIAGYLSNQQGTYGLYFIDLKSGVEFGYNSLLSFHAASTFKVPMNLYLYREVTLGNVAFDEQLTFDKRHLEGGTGILKNQQTGAKYTVRQLASYSIVDSDNVATNILLERLGKKNIKNYSRSLGGKLVDDKENITCPHDLALYMKEVINAASNQTESKLLLNDLYNAKFKDRIPAPLPSRVKTANKIGTWPLTNTYNDIAYVLHPERPYILAITSKNTPGYGETLPVIHYVSKIVYDYQSTPIQPSTLEAHTAETHS